MMGRETEKVNIRDLTDKQFADMMRQILPSLLDHLRLQVVLESTPDYESYELVDSEHLCS